MCDEYLIQLIQESLRNFEKDPELKICEIKESKGSKEGDNYMSVVKSVEVFGRTGNGAAYSSSLFIKNPPPDSERCKLFSIDKAFKNESIMYKEYFTKVVEFDLPVARCVHADNNSIIFENLKTAGYKMGDRRASLDLFHCRLSIQALAKFHSSSYFLKTMKNGELNELMSKITCFTLVGSFYSRMIENSITGCLKVLRKYKDDPAIADVIPKIEKLVDNGLETMVSRTKSDKLAVLCHGDFWINNLLFRYDGANRLRDVKILDFQAPRFQSFAVDLWTFIYTSVQPNLLGNCMLEDIVKLYFHTFISSFKSKIPESTIPTFSDVLNEFHEKQLYGFLVAMWYLPALYVDSCTAPDFDDMMSQDVSKSDITHRIELPKEYDDRVLTIVKLCNSSGVFDKS